MFGLLSNNNNNNNEGGGIAENTSTTDDFVPYKFLVPLSDDILPVAPTTTTSSSSARSSSPFKSTLHKLSRLTMRSNRSTDPPTSHPSTFSSSTISATMDIYKSSLDSSSVGSIINSNNTYNQSTPVKALEGIVTHDEDSTHPLATRGWSSSLISSVSASAQARFASPLRLSSTIGRLNRLTTTTLSIANTMTTTVKQDNTMTTTDPVDLSSVIDMNEQSVPYKFLVPSSSSSSSSTNDFLSQPTTASPTTINNRSCQLSFFLSSPSKNSSSGMHAEVPNNSNNNYNYTNYISRSFRSNTNTSTTTTTPSTSMDDQYTIQQQQQQSSTDEKHGSSWQSTWTSSWPYLTGPPPPHTIADTSPSSSSTSPSSSSSFSSPLARSKGRLIRSPTMLTTNEVTTTHETDSKYEEMRGQIDFLNDAIEKLGQKMNTQLQSKSDELEQMKTKLTAANSNAEQLSSSNSQLQQQYAYACNEYRNLEQSKVIVIQERDMLMVEVQQTKQIVAQKQSKESELIQQIQQLRSQSQQSIEDLTAKKDYECSSRVEQISVEYNALMLENMNLKKQMCTKMEELQSKSDELEQMKIQLTAANSNAEQLSSSNSQLQQQYAYACNEYRNLEQSKINILKDQEILMMEVKQTKHMVAQKQSKESELMQQINSLIQQNDSLRTQNQQSIHDWTTKCDEYKNKQEKTSTHYNALMLENMNLKKQTAELSRLVPALESKVENLQFSNRQLQSAQEELSAKYQQQLMSSGSKITIGGFQQQQQHRG